MKFGCRFCLKPSNDRGEFELERTKSKNNIAENLFALGHETDNSKQINVFKLMQMTFHSGHFISQHVMP